MFKWSEETGVTSYGKFYCHYKEGVVIKSSELNQFGDEREIQLENSLNTMLKELLSENGEFARKYSFIQIKL